MNTRLSLEVPLHESEWSSVSVIPEAIYNSCKRSSQTDQILLNFLERKAIDPASLGLVRARWDSERGRILYPRFGRNECDVLPPKEVSIVGWKVRDLLRGRHYNEPDGISHTQTWPLVARSASPASRLFGCEGETDTIALAQSGLGDVWDADIINIPGAQAFPAEWVPLFRSYDEVYIFADQDDAGRQLPDRVAGLVPGTRLVLLPQQHDVCEFLATHSADEMEMLIKSSSLHMVQQKIRHQNWDWTTGDASTHRNKLMRIVLKDVRLSRRGNNEFVGLCPFHEEKTPSFSVNSEKGLYKCWGCHAAGDVITYLKAKHGMGYRDALATLEDIR